MEKKISYVTGSILLLLYYFTYRGALSHLIFYHEQHHLFLFSKAYFHRQIASEGWLGYASDFLIQFFYYPVLGCALLAMLLASVYLLTRRLIRTLTGKNDLLQLSALPSLGLFLYTMQADHSLNPVTGSFLLLVALNLLLWPLQRYGVVPFSLFRPLRISGPRLRLVLPLCASLIYAIGTYSYFLRTYNIGERIMLRAEQAVKMKDWHTVLDYTERYLNSGRSNQLISYFHNLALYHTGQLPYHLFDYPQKLGVKGLYFPWNSDSRESEYGHFLYEDLGYVNEAHRWEFEAMVVWGETAPHLLNLAKYNIVNGRNPVAQRFINLLKQSLFYRQEALQLERYMQKGQVPGIHNALENTPADVPARFANVLNIGPELEYLCMNDPDNRMAFEYLMADLLLSNHVVRFVQNLKQIERFSYASLPPVYEEALYIYKLGVGNEEFAKTGFTVRRETEQRFKRYYQLMQNRQMQALQAEFGKTYWFYLNYLSPYGNKVIAN